MCVLHFHQQCLSPRCGCYCRHLVLRLICTLCAPCMSAPSVCLQHFHQQCVSPRCGCYCRHLELHLICTLCAPCMFAPSVCATFIPTVCIKVSFATSGTLYCVKYAHCVHLVWATFSPAVHCRVHQGGVATADTLYAPNEGFGRQFLFSHHCRRQ